MNDKAIAKAQEMVDSTVDIRPALKGKIVAAVEGDRLCVKVTFTSGDYLYYTGLFAKLISAQLPVEQTLNSTP